jgi:hypothetical protein
LVYLAKDTKFGLEERELLETHFFKLRKLYLRVEALPRNALIEVELVCNTGGHMKTTMPDEGGHIKIFKTGNSLLGFFELDANIERIDS